MQFVTRSSRTYSHVTGILAGDALFSFRRWGLGAPRDGIGTGGGGGAHCTPTRGLALASCSLLEAVEL